MLQVKVTNINFQKISNLHILIRVADVVDISLMARLKIFQIVNLMKDL